MSGTKGTETALTAVISRRDAIMGALAIAAGTLIASKPDTARAANGEAVFTGGTYYVNQGTYLGATSDGTSGGTALGSVVIDAVHPVDGSVIALSAQVDADAPSNSFALDAHASTPGQISAQLWHVYAEGIALRVDGRAQFTRSGKGSISHGHASATVTPYCGVATGDLILVTLQGSAGTGVYLRYAKRVSGSTTKFQVVLNKAVTTSKVDFAWFILN